MTVDKLQESGARMETIIHIGSMFVQGVIPDDVAELFEEDCESIWAALGLPSDDVEGMDGWQLEDYFDDPLVHKSMGFLCKVAHPVPKNITKTGFEFSWGSYTWHWVYADTFEEACDKGAVWAANYIAEKRKAAA